MMKAIILAAGVASRLRPLTDNTPKCLLPVGEKSILERTIENLMENGVNELVLVTGYLRHMIEDFVMCHKPYPDPEGEISVWAKKELAEARKIPVNECLSSEEVKQMILKK